MLSAVNPERWRMTNGVDLDSDPRWEETRRKILIRDKNTCVDCGFESPKYMEVHHDGGHFENDSDTSLSTLCPLCHACRHIGFHGINENGRLLILSGNIPQTLQAKLNRKILESLKEGDDGIFERLLGALPVQKDLGAEGLVALADRIIELSESDVVPSNFIFFPEKEKFRIFRFISGGKDAVLWSKQTLGELARSIPYEEFVSVASREIGDEERYVATFFEDAWKIICEPISSGTSGDPNVIPYGIRRKTHEKRSGFTILDKDGRETQDSIPVSEWGNFYIFMEDVDRNGIENVLIDVLWFILFSLNEKG